MICMLENQPGTTPWVFQQDDLCFSDSNTGAAGINGLWFGRCCLTLGWSWSSPDSLGEEKGSGRVWKWVSSDGWSPKPQLCSCSAWIRCLDLEHEHVMILRLWAVSTKNRNGPVWGLGQQLWCLRARRFYLSPSANLFLIFGNVAASVSIKETCDKRALSSWEGKHQLCFSFL